MKHITQTQLDRLNALYSNGQLDGNLVGDWTVLSLENGMRLIEEAEKIPVQTYQPATETLKEYLLELIRTGNLNMREEVVCFITLSKAEELSWMFHSTDKNAEPDVTHAQAKRIKVLMAKGFLKYRPLGEIKNLSFKKAAKLIEEGEANALNER